MSSQMNNKIAESFEKLNNDISNKESSPGSSSIVSDADKNKFQELISTKSESNTPPALITEKAPEDLTLGDKVLQRIHGIGSNFENQADAMRVNITSHETMDIKTMFKTQLAMSNLLITQDYTAKIVSKGTQAFDTLLKNQ